uniref:Uncharacterized protein n=1 Tax=Arundo donax TaxID=35708 RepID=A0A0A9DNB5_ARUDO
MKFMLQRMLACHIKQLPRQLGSQMKFQHLCLCLSP